MRYYALEGKDDSPHVIAETCDLEVAQQFLRVSTRMQLLAHHPEALARWETDDDAVYEAYMSSFEAELDREEAAYFPRLRAVPQ